VPYVSLRYANVYGPRQNARGEANVVATFCLKLLAAEQPVINGDGKQTRDFVHVTDVVNANLLALDSQVGGHFNVGTGRQVDINQVFRVIAACLRISAREVHGPPRPGDQRTSALDSSLIAEKLGWRPQITIEDGLQDTADWLRARAATTNKDA